MKASWPAAARYDAADFRRRARAGLHASPPLEALDPDVAAPRGDDDLNPHLAPTGAAGAGRPAAVLVPVVARQPQLTVLLTLRTDHLPSHGGQVAFPGGKIDTADTSPMAAALREAHEEIGLEPDLVEPLGYLDTYQTRTGFRVVPLVGLIDPQCRFAPAPHEVADIFEVPLGFLMDPVNHLQQKRLWQGVERRFYAMPYGDRFIWGATAGMLRNLYERVYAR